ncbi:MAG: hypothetical protein HYY84_13875 [Deltaproteobacteria bacterium]|nr:hypothetical protein [Deltaproteobacteria bacterium]
MNKIRRLFTIIGLGALTAVALNLNEVRASTPPTFDSLGEKMGDALIIMGVGVGLGLSTVPVIMNAFSIEKGRRGPAGTIGFGLIIASLDVALAAPLLTWEGDRGAKFRTLGFISIGLSALNFGLSVWSAVLPKKPIDSPIIPTVIADSRGKLVPALTTKLFTF